MAKQALTEEQKEKREYWKRHIEQWMQSGIKQVEYCRQHQLSTKSFTYWKRIYKQGSSVSFIPVQVKPEAGTANNNSSSLVVHKDGYRIEIKEGIKAEVLGTVLRTIQEMQC